MRINIKRLNRCLETALRRNYLQYRKEQYVETEEITINILLDFCSIRGRYGVKRTDEKAWEKDFCLYVSPKDLTNYSYLEGCFSQYIFDKERNEMNENNKSKTRKRD